MKVQRIVKRQNMRTQFENLKKVVTSTRAIVQAEQQLQRAYTAGFHAGLQQASEALVSEHTAKVPQESSDAIPVSHS